MADEHISELQERLFVLERKIKPLEWDLSRNQINEFKKNTLNQLKAEFNTIKSELDSLKQ